MATEQERRKRMPKSGEIGGKDEHRPIPNLSKLPDPPVISPNDVPNEYPRVGTSHLTVQFVSIIAIILLALFSYPLLVENVGNECSAFEANALSAASQNTVDETASRSGRGLGTLKSSFQGSSSSASESDIIKIKYPDIPAPIGCMIGYYQLLINPKNWKNFFVPLVANASDANGHNNSLVRTRSAQPKKVKQQTSAYESRKDRAPNAPQIASVNDLALGFDKLRWGMSISEVKSLWPAQETPSLPAPRLDGPPIQPRHTSATLSLNDYVYAGCTFVVKFRFDDEKLNSVDLEADGSVNFNMCHIQIVASLLRQYGEDPGGISPASSYHGYSVHGEWRGSITDVVYNELQNAIIEISLSSTNALP